MPLDSISIARLQLVNPSLSRIVNAMAEFLDQEQISFRVTQGFRTWAEQDALFAQGRTIPGQIVTHAKGGESWHNLGCAIDFVPMKAGDPVWNTSDPAWKRIIAIGKSMLLTSGMNWTHPDEPHFQYTAPYPENKPTEEAQQIFKNEGSVAFWGTLTPLP